MKNALYTGPARQNGIAAKEMKKIFVVACVIFIPNVQEIKTVPKNNPNALIRKI